MRQVDSPSLLVCHPYLINELWVQREILSQQGNTQSNGGTQRTSTLASMFMHTAAQIHEHVNTYAKGGGNENRYHFVPVLGISISASWGSELKLSTPAESSELSFTAAVQVADLLYDMSRFLY